MRAMYVTGQIKRKTLSQFLDTQIAPIELVHVDFFTTSSNSDRNNLMKRMPFKDTQRVNVISGNRVTISTSTTSSLTAE